MRGNVSLSEFLEGEEGLTKVTKKDRMAMMANAKLAFSIIHCLFPSTSI